MGVDGLLISHDERVSATAYASLESASAPGEPPDIQARWGVLKGYNSQKLAQCGLEIT